MINNSYWYRWDRLAAKSLDQQFVNDIIRGLNCSPFEAEAVPESVYCVFGDCFDTGDNLKAGQIKLSVVSIEGPSAQRLSDAKQVSFTLSLTDDKEDLPILKQSGVVDIYINPFYVKQYAGFIDQDAGGIQCITASCVFRSK